MACSHYFHAAVLRASVWFKLKNVRNFFIFGQNTLRALNSC